jgi:phosphotransferase system enzyme I (PtsI)
MVLKGQVAVEGIGIGLIQIVNNNIDNFLNAYIQEDMETEKNKYQQAVNEVKIDIKQLLQKIKNSDDDPSIMEAHLMMIDDIMLAEKIILNIEQGQDAPTAITNASIELENMFNQLEDAYLKERAADVKDVCKQILFKVIGAKRFSLVGSNKIIIADDIEPSLMASFNSNQVSGIILKNGSMTSHSIIIARSKGIPTIVGVSVNLEMVDNETMAIISGEGHLIINPTTKEEEYYQLQKEKNNKLLSYYLSTAKLPAITLNQKEVTVAANIATPDDVEYLEDNGVDGVGLYRTEFLFMESSQLPSEEKQFNAYKKAIMGCNQKLCIIRTLDIGGDKPLESIQLDGEENPFLGYRAIRICLDQRDLFKKQLRSILRASAYGNTAILLPMIINVEEIIKTKELIKEIMLELSKEQTKYDQDIKIGMMIETPASVIMASLFSKYVDFFSIGTNDLIQYTLAVDRGNQKVSYLYNYYNPAVLHSIKRVVDAAHNEDKWVGVCGEMGADKKGIVALLSLGVDELSMSSILVPERKEFIRNFNNDLIDTNLLLECKTPEEAKSYLSTVEKQIDDSIKSKLT